MHHRLWKRGLSDEDGITLVEILIVLALIGIVHGLAFSLYYFGATAFSGGENQSIVQQRIRLASRIITDEVRYAYSVELFPELNLPNNANQFGDDQFIVQDNGRLVLLNRYNYHDGGRILLESDTIEFLVGSSGRTLEFSLAAGRSDRSHAVLSEVLVLNLEAESIEAPASDLSEAVIKYNTTMPDL